MEHDREQDVTLRCAGRVARILVMAGGLAAAGTQASAAPTPDESQYLSADCARMHDAIRHANRQTATSRGLSDLRRTFAEQCAVEVERARYRVREDKRKRWEAEWQVKAQSERQARQEVQAAEMLSAQCQEMKQALENRRKRTGSSAGEQRDLQLFEQRYQERCGR